MKVGFVGTGIHGTHLINHFMGLDAEVGLVYGHRNRDLIPRCTFTESVDEVIQSSDAVVVATPAAVHFDIGMKVVSAGKALFLEKPITITVEEAHLLRNAVQSAETAFMGGHCLCYSDWMPEEIYRYGIARQAVRGLGEPNNPYWVVGIHLLSVLVLLGVPEYAIEFIVDPAMEPERLLTLISESGQKTNWEPTGDILKNECAAFIKCVESGVEPLTGIKHCVSVVEVLERRYGTW